MKERIEDLHDLLQSYYSELDPAKRQPVLEEYSKAAAQEREEEGADISSQAADAYRQELFEARHIDKKHAGKLIDRFLWNLMSMSTIYKSPGFFPKRHKREVLSVLKKMQLDDRPLTDPACGEALYREYRNTIHRYYVSCDDYSYGRSLFGMMPADAAKRAALCCTDIWNFTYGIAGMVGLEEEMSILCRAANDEYCALVPEAVSLEDAYRKFNPKKA